MVRVEWGWVRVRGRLGQSTGRARYDKDMVTKGRE